MKIGDVVRVEPETIIWDQTTRTLRGEAEGKKILVPTCQLALQDLKWNKTDFPEEIEETIKEGFNAIVRRIDHEQIIASRREWQERQYNKLKEGEIYQGKIVRVTPYSVFVKVNGLRIRVYVTDCSRARINDLRDFFKPGGRMRVKILQKHKCFPYHISGSRKEAYHSFEEVSQHYDRWKYIYAKICERLNDEGYWIEITPNVTGLLNGPKEQLDRLEKGQKVKAQIIEIYKLGIKCRVAK